MTVSTNMKRIQKTKSKLNTENLLEKIVEKRNFFEAYKKVVANKGSSGIDGMRVDELLPYLQENYEILKANLLNGEYKPRPVKRVEIPKPNGGIRLLGIPNSIRNFQIVAMVLDQAKVYMWL